MKKHPATAWHLALDIGREYTGGCAYLEDTHEFFQLRLPTHPENPHQTAIHLLKEITRVKNLNIENLNRIIQSSTLTLPMLQSVPGVGLLVTQGFKDMTKFLPGESLTFEVTERVLPGNNILVPLNEAQIISLIPEIKKSGIQSLGICFLHSYHYPHHEQKVKEILNRHLPQVHITLSSEILPEADEYKRMVMTIMNAATSTFAKKSCQEFHEFLGNDSSKIDFFFMQSDGTLTTAEFATINGVKTLFSGPAAGMSASLVLARQSGRPNVITFDLGASGARVGLIVRDQPKQTDPEDFSQPIQGIPQLHMAVTPMGTFSPFAVNGQQQLETCSPHHREAYLTGPSLPTCADANNILGRTSLEQYMPDTRDKAEEAIQRHIANKKGTSVNLAALEMIHQLNAHLADIIRESSIRQGHDPREFSLLAYGSAGPQHAAEIAAMAGIPRVIVPRNPGTHSSRGLLFAETQREYVVPFSIPWNKASHEDINHSFAKLEEKAQKELARLDIKEIIFRRSADMRLKGQPQTMNMQMPAGQLKQADLSLLNRTLIVNCRAEGIHLSENAELQWVQLKLTAIKKNFIQAKKPEPTDPAYQPYKPTAAAAKMVAFSETPQETPVYRWNDLNPLAEIQGPAVVDDEETSVIIYPGMSATLDLLGNIIIEVDDH